MGVIVQVPFVDLRAQQRDIGGAISAAVEDVLTGCDFILGAAVERFEAAYAAYIGRRHAIGVGTGLAAIEIALRAHYPAKNLGACGDGGMIVTDDDGVAERARVLRNYGQRAKYHHSMVGTNSRLDTLQAAILGVKLPYLDGWNTARRRHARAYGERLAGLVRTPSAAAHVEHVYHLYVIETDRRDAVQRHLRAGGVDTGIHYPIPVHLQEACAHLGHRAGEFPVAEAAAARILSLPMYPELAEAQLAHVAASIVEAVRAE